ncbi:uncharacterized protein [Dermacentor andersoni]|uniref:uncharacterized protein isoform X3 n=1 Tax=Dermacentor andersoni TaxID=34620 RepID=UPI003B3B2E50
MLRLPKIPSPSNHVLAFSLDTQAGALTCIRACLDGWNVTAGDMWDSNDRTSIEKNDMFHNIYKTQYFTKLLCYPDVGEWYLMFRNFYEDPDFGGVRHCVKFRRYGTYSFENHSTSVEFAFGSEGSIRGEFTMTSSDCYAAKDRVIYQRYDNISSPRNFRVLYTDCTFCSILRHPYAANVLP